MLDLGSGSGLVAIAVMKVGAAAADAADIDPFAIAAIGLNAAANSVAVRAVAGDRKVIAHLAKVPDGARVRQIGNALDLADRTVARSLDRLAADGLVVLEAEGESLPMRSYRLAD